MSIAAADPVADADPASGNSLFDVIRIGQDDGRKPYILLQRQRTDLRLTWAINLIMATVYLGLYSLDQAGYHAARNALLLIALMCNLGGLAVAVTMRSRR